MEVGIQPSYILGADEAIVLAAVEEFDDVVDGKKVHRQPGQCWMITGPTEYIPPVDVKVVETRCVREGIVLHSCTPHCIHIHVCAYTVWWGWSLVCWWHCVLCVRLCECFGCGHHTHRSLVGVAWVTVCGMNQVDRGRLHCVCCEPGQCEQMCQIVVCSQATFHF